jgi:tetratricopeptide (TPR) repeat protein
MEPEPFSFQHALEDFDLSKLPIDAKLLLSDPSLLARAIQGYYEQLFTDAGGTAMVAIRDGLVHVQWRPEAGDPEEALFRFSVKLLRRGDYKSAEPVLRALLARNPNHPDVLCNLGMMLSDQGRLTEAIELLSRYVDSKPNEAKGWTALGVAYSRIGDGGRATEALGKAVALEPDNPHSLRNLGGLLLKHSPDQALPLLERATHILPDVQAALFGLAQCLLALGRTSDADTQFARVIETSPLTEIAEQARQARTRLAEESHRSASAGQARANVMEYCLDGLKRLTAMNEEGVKAAVYEIAMLGRAGFDTNDPQKKHRLQSLPGEFSGLHLVSLMYTGLRLLKLDASVGMDISREFEAAKALFDSNHPR